MLMPTNPRNEYLLFACKALTVVLLSGDGPRGSQFCTHSSQYRDAGRAKEI
jgi:hypothetical protein